MSIYAHTSVAASLRLLGPAARCSYPERPLHDILDTSAVDFPDSPATAFLGATLTFAEIKDSFGSVRQRAGWASASRRATASASCCPTARSHHRGVRGAASRRGDRQHQPDLHGARGADGRQRLGHPRADHARCARPARAARFAQQTSIEEIVVTSIAEYYAPRRPRRLELTALAR